MAKYFKIVLKSEFQTDEVISKLNKLLINDYGCELPEDFLFNSWPSLQRKADSFNFDLPDYFCFPVVISPQAITAEQLHDNFEKFQHGAFVANYLFLSDREYLSALRAIMTWMNDTKDHMVDLLLSQNYHYIDLQGSVPDVVLREIFC